MYLALPIVERWIESGVRDTKDETGSPLVKLKRFRGKDFVTHM